MPAVQGVFYAVNGKIIVSAHSDRSIRGCWGERKMFGKKFQLNSQNLEVIEEIGKHMPGGFFIYREEKPGELLYANHAVYNIFGCKTGMNFVN